MNTEIEGIVELAIDHEEYGPRIQAARILTPQEASTEMRLRQLKTKLDEARALIGDGKNAKGLRARLETAMDDLEELRKLEEVYIGEEDRLKLGQWPPADPYREIDEGTAIMEFVIERYRGELAPFKLAVVFQEKVPPVNGRGRLGTAMKLPGKMLYLSEYHGVVTIGFGDWRVLSDRDRQRLIHHELEHLQVEDGLVRLRTHDFEDFVSIVQLYGLRSESERFSTDGRVAEVLRNGSQLELMAS